MIRHVTFGYLISWWALVTDRLMDAWKLNIRLRIYTTTVLRADEGSCCTTRVAGAVYRSAAPHWAIRHSPSAIATSRSLHQLLVHACRPLDTSFANNVINYSFSRFGDDDNHPSLKDRRAGPSLRQLGQWQLPVSWDWSADIASHAVE